MFRLHVMLGLAVVLALSAAVPAQAQMPFGFDLDKDPSTYTDCSRQDETPYVYRCVAPKGHSYFSEYELVYLPQFGVCSIEAGASLAIKKGVHPSERNVPFFDLIDQIRLRYGGVKRVFYGNSGRTAGVDYEELDYEKLPIVGILPLEAAASSNIVALWEFPRAPVLNVKIRNIFLQSDKGPFPDLRVLFRTQSWRACNENIKDRLEKQMLQERELEEQKERHWKDYFKRDSEAF